MDDKEAVLERACEAAYTNLLAAQKAVKDAEYAVKIAREVHAQRQRELDRYRMTREVETTRPAA